MEVLIRIKDNKDELPLRQGEYEIFRGPNAAPIFAPVFIKGPGYEQGRIIADASNGGSYISGKHLGVVVGNDKVELKDICSRNGSFLEGRKFEETTVNSIGVYKVRLGLAFDFELIVS